MEKEGDLEDEQLLLRMMTGGAGGAGGVGQGGDDGDELSMCESDEGEHRRSLAPTESSTASATPSMLSSFSDMFYPSSYKTKKGGFVYAAF